MTTTWEIREGDALKLLREMPDESVQCCVTSPPYWGLRDYGLPPSVWGGDLEHDHEWGDEVRVRETTYGGKTRWQHVHNGRGEFQESRSDREGWLRADVTRGQFCACGAWLGVLGLEPTPELYTEHMVLLFREVRRVLRADGTLWLNLGDCFNAYNGNAGPSSSLSQTQSAVRPHLTTGHGKRAKGLKPKDLVGVPWRVAFALQADGWWLRSDIIWSKPNPMPESITDRPTNAHEHVFLLAKSARYFYDAEAIRETGNVEHWLPGGGRNKRNVWEIATRPYPDAHFATFPPKLVEPCVLAGSPPEACAACASPRARITERYDTGQRQRMADGWDTGDGGHGTIHRDGRQAGEAGLPVMATRTIGWKPSCEHESGPAAAVVLDPFAGAGTTGLVALRHGRSFLGLELNPEYAEVARERIRQDAPLLNTPAEVAA